MKNDYEIRGDHVVIFIPYKRENTVKECLIDIDDFELINGFKNTWFISGTIELPYVAIHFDTIKPRSRIMHRVVTKAQTEMKVDHINHDTLDNRKKNLRIVEHFQNGHNLKVSRKGRPDNMRGINWSKSSGKWRSRIKIKGKEIYLGAFETIEEARICRELANEKYSGVTLNYGISK